MARSTRARNPELSTRVTDPESILRSAREKPSTSVKEQMLGDNERASTAGEAKAGN